MMSFSHSDALSPGLNAQSEGKRLGILRPSDRILQDFRDEQPKDSFEVKLLHSAVPAIATPNDIWAVERGKPTSATSVE
jgi:hypothetical protein